MGFFKCVSVMYGGLDDAWLEKAEVEECTPDGNKKAAKVLLMEDGEIVFTYYEDRYMSDKLLELELKSVKACLLIEYNKLKLKKVMGGNFRE